MISEEDDPLSNVDINRLMKELDSRGANIKITENLRNGKYENLNELFDNRGHAIMHHVYDEENPDNAHWVVCIRNGEHKYVYYFDSFGYENTEENIPYLKKLCDESQYALLANENDYQESKTSVCGRWCLLISCLNKLGLSPSDIEETIKNITDKKLITIVNEDE